MSYCFLDQVGGGEGVNTWTGSTYTLEEESKGLPNKLNGMDRRRESVKENNLWA